MRGLANNLERYNSRYGEDTLLACRRGAQLQRIVLSYTYIDQCGNYYRGVWTARLVGRELDSTLWARGIEMPGGALRRTQSLSYTAFDLLVPLFPGDVALINDSREKALRSAFSQADDGLIFVPNSLR